jgi:glutamate-1-semialdehyde 2,1-aminomutase
VYPDQSSESARLFERAVRVLPGGNSRTTIFMSPYAPYAAHGTGCRVTDVDGVERIDFLNNYTALIHGHAHAPTMDAVRNQLDLGVSYAMPTVPEIELAELLCNRIPSADQARFTNSGTEAVMLALKAARAFTRRPKIAKCEGAYHGSYDFAEVSLDSSPENWGDDEPEAVAYARGTPDAVLENVVVLPFNDVATTERLLERHAGELAAILVDPLPNRGGLIPASSEFLAMLRRVADAHGIVLIFDEVISFRIGYQGAQHVLGVVPDLTTLGKIIGGGFPVGAVVGRAGIMSVFDPRRGKPALPHGGTFNANPITMVAGLATMRALTESDYQRLNQLGQLARSGITSAFAQDGVAAQVTGFGSLFMLHLHDRPLTSYRDAYRGPEEQKRLAQVQRALLNAGIIIAPNGLGAISTPMTKAEIVQLVSAVRSAVRDVAPGHPLAITPETVR